MFSALAFLLAQILLRSISFFVIVNVGEGLACSTLLTSGTETIKREKKKMLTWLLGPPFRFSFYLFLFPLRAVFALC
jgi:hypothetical protein